MEEMRPKTTIYIPSRNYGRYLEEAIESVIRQSSDDWELLLFDEASEDETASVIKNYEGHPKIRSFRTEVIGMPAICNLALEEANTDYIMRLDSDDVLEENALLVLQNALERRPDAALAFPDYYLVDQNGRAFRHESRAQLYSHNHLFDQPPNGACTLIRTDVLKSIGGYREDLGAQDGLDLWTKLEREHVTLNITLPLFYYRRHGTNLTNRTERIFTARKQIKYDAIQADLDKVRPIIAIIPCREHYDFEANLWKESLNKETLLHRSIASCVAVKEFDHIVVTCDNDAIKEHLNDFKDPRIEFISRSADSTPRRVSVVPTLKAITQRLDPSANGICVLRYIQAPFVKSTTMLEAIATLLISDSDSACPVEKLNNAVYRRGPYGLECINPQRPITTDFDSIYSEHNTCLATLTKNFHSGSLMGARVASFELQRKECFFVDSEYKLKLAQVMDAESKG